MPSSKVIEAVMVTAELLATNLSKAAVRVLLSDLDGFDEAQVLKALVRCRREVKPGRFGLSEIMDRIDDGHPGPEQAWAVVCRANDERETVIWTEQMAVAYRHCLALMSERDMVAARMAFKEAYTTEVDEARLFQRKPVWSPCVGTDLSKRAAVLEAGVIHGLLTHEQRIDLLPPVKGDDEEAVKKKIKAGQLLLAYDPKGAEEDPTLPGRTVAELLAPLRKSMTLAMDQRANANQAENDALAARKAEIQARVDAFQRNQGVQP